MKKNITFELPPYLTIGQYQAMAKGQKGTKFEYLTTTVSALTKYPLDEVEQWDVKSMKKIFDKFKDIDVNNSEFHSLIEWNGKLHGYSHINSQTLGEYVDLEHYCENVEENLHKIAALMYRPVKKHKFKTLKFTIDHQLKILQNRVANVFDYYKVEKYDSDYCDEVSEGFKDFPAYIILGAIGFFLTTGNLYLNNTISSQDQPKMRAMMQTHLLTSLGQSIGLGGGLSTTSPKPAYLQLQEIPALQT